MVAIITGIIGISTAATIMILIRKDHLHVRYGLWWMIAAVCFSLLGFFPGIFDNVSKYLGIANPPILAVAIGIVLVILKILVMDIERSSNAIKLQRLIQRIALLESDLRELQGKPREGDQHSDHGEPKEK